MNDFEKIVAQNESISDERTRTMKPIYIRVRKYINPPGIVGTVLEVRVSNDIVSPTYYRWATTSDYNNVASRVRMLDNLLKMIEEAQS